MTPSPSHDGPRATLLAHAAWVRRLAADLTRDEHEARDLEQDVWLMALRRPPRQPSAARAWLGRLIRRRASRLWQARTRTPEALSVEPEAETRRRLEFEDRVLEALRALDEPFRTVVRLRYLDDLPPREIARRLQLPGTTVRTRLTRGLAQLRRRLDAHQGGRHAWRSAALALLAPPSPSPLGATAWSSTLLAVFSMKLLVPVLVLAALLVVLLSVTTSESPGLALDPGTAERKVSDDAQSGVPVAEEGTILSSRPFDAESAKERDRNAASVERARHYPPALAAGAWAAVRVLDEDGGPFLGASVDFVHRRADGGVQRWSRTTDAEGRARLELPAGLHWWELRARPRAPRRSADWARLDLQRESTIRLRRDAEEVEFLLRRRDTPVPGRLWVIADEGPEARIEVHESDPAGSVRLALGRGASWRVLGVAEEETNRIIELKGTDRPAGPVRLEVVAPPRPARLVGAESDAPVVGATVIMNGHPIATGPSATDGAIEILPLPQDLLMHHVKILTSEGASRPVVRTTSGSPQLLHVAEPVFTVRVVDPEGTPIAGATVSWSGLARSAGEQQTWTDSEGLAHDLKRRDRDLLVSAPGYRPALFPRRASPQEVTLHPGPAVPIAVRDPRGEAVPFAEIQIVLGTSGRGGRPGLLLLRADAQGRARAQVGPGARGAARRPGGSWSRFVAIDSERATIRIVAPDPVSHRLAGRIESRPGHLRSRPARVTATDRAGRREALTTSDGRFDFGTGWEPPVELQVSDQEEVALGRYRGPVQDGVRILADGHYPLSLHLRGAPASELPIKVKIIAEDHRDPVPMTMHRDRNEDRVAFTLPTRGPWRLEISAGSRKATLLEVHPGEPSQPAEIAVDLE